MMYLNSFLFVGITCLVAQIILDNTNLTPGHITASFTVLGSFLSYLNIYPIFRKWAGVGASIPITSFGDLLYTSCYEGYQMNGILGMFSNLLTSTSAGICSAVIFASILAIIFKPKD